MSEFPKFLARGERARLFPVLADTSKEGRTVSILMACLANVPAFGREMMATVGQRVGTRAQIQTYTEIGFQTQRKDKPLRPDGLLVLQVNSREWRALVEAKVGLNELDPHQIESYVEAARANGIDALITVSNQYTSTPTHSPVTLPSSLRGKIEVYHWSWMDILTKATLLMENEEVEDPTQSFIISEMVRFLAHQSSGVKGFDQMPAAWSEVVSDVQAGGTLAPGASETREVVDAWHQETRNLTLMLSRQLGLMVKPNIPRLQKNDHELRIRTDAKTLSDHKHLKASIDVPGAASNLDICVDLMRRSFTVSMWLKAPEDRKGSKARVNWLLRQLIDAPADNLYVRLIGPGGVQAQKSLSVLRQNVDTIVEERGAATITSFEIILVKDVGPRFGQRRNFIVDLEAAVPAFYDGVGQHLKAFQVAAPRIRDDRTEPSSVSIEAIREEVEHVDLPFDVEGEIRPEPAAHVPDIHLLNNPTEGDDEGLPDEFLPYENSRLVPVPNYPAEYRRRGVSLERPASVVLGAEPV